MTTFDEVVAARASCRAYLPTPVDTATLEEVLGLAQLTASWCNTQPWRAHLVTGAATEAFAAHLAQAVATRPSSSDLAMPAGYSGVYAERRRASGYALYAALGIDRADHEARAVQMLKNFSFFGAPHVVVVTTDREQGTYGAIDCGGYVATLLLAATSRGLGTCAQAAIAMYSDDVRAFLGLSDDRLVVCAIALGHPDPEHPANAFRTERADLAEVVEVIEEV